MNSANKVNIKIVRLFTKNIAYCLLVIISIISDICPVFVNKNIITNKRRSYCEDPKVAVRQEVRIKNVVKPHYNYHIYKSILTSIY